mmetsp:Transcript_35916/g.70679  ORF Transcript_35916/g.70679 Transcript_35916/m.70679 type:complete len:339 (+) Transcript_35916:595-1611(+)
MTGERWNQWDEKAQYVLSYKPDPVIKRLHLTYSTFPGWTVPTPQYERFVVWMKRHIQEDNPVIFAAFVKTGRAEWYQHIAVAFGIRSTTLAAEDDSYNPDDLIDWLPLEPSYTRREWSTRAVQGFNETKNGTDEGNEVFRIPNNVTFGTAITGIKNGEGTLPVRLQMPYDSPYESPNLSGCNASVVYCFAPGEPEPFYVVIYVEDLTPGQRYLALRYDGYATVPKEGGFCSEAARANATQTWLFEAEREMMLIDDVLQQDQAVFYRAVPACEGMENATLTWQQNWLDYGWTFNETSREWSFHMWGMDYVATNGWTWADWEPENVTETASDSESNRLRM